jgi:energy-coupling factor transporter ATP-binding protein EcfA2
MAAILGTVRDRGKTILVVTHQSALMEQVADEFVHMSGGKIESREPVRPLPVAANSAGGDR